MTVIRPNSISGVSSITGQGGDISIFRADGTAADVTVNNITSGVVTATTFKGAIDATTGTFSGNLGVGGVLTYEDVTNIDSIGIVTARLGINLVGNDLNVGSNIKIGNASGIVTATSFSGDGSALTGVGASFGNSSINTSGIITATAFVPTSQGALSHRNIITNGKADVFQRVLGGSQVTCNSGSNFYCMDRWYARGESSLGVFNLIQQDISSEGQGALHAIRVNVTTNVTPGSGDVYKIAKRIEGKNIGHLSFGTSNAKTITLSFLVKSSVTGTHGGSLMNSAQNRSFPFTYTINSANTWESKSITIPGDTGGTWVINTGIGLELNFDIGSGSAKRGSAGGTWIAARAEGASGTVQLISTSSANWYVTKVQIEEGPVATPFEHRSFEDELRRCERYYQVLAESKADSGVSNISTHGGNFYGVIQLHTVMRASPSLVVSNFTNAFRAYGNQGTNPSTLTLNTGGTHSMVIQGSGDPGTAGWLRLYLSSGGAFATVAALSEL